MKPTRWWAALAFCLYLCSSGEVSAQSVLDEEVFPTDPRVIEAHSLLEKSSGWNRAIQLYREALVDDPEDLTARLFLARVLAWSTHYDESFVEYYELLDRVPGAELRAEYAETLSWAGRYDDSETIFLALLEEDPTDHRAALGLARVYNWSGQSRQAEEAYERALEMSEDAEVRGELDALERTKGFASHAKSDSDYVSDSSEFQMFQTGAKASTDLNPKTRVLVHAGFTNISDGRALSTGHSNGVDVLAGVERRLGSGVLLSLEAGGRRWSSSPDTALARAELKYTPSARLAMGFELGYSDFLRSLSFDAVMSGLNESQGRAWVWHELAASIEGFGYFEASHISDSNARLSGGLSTEWRPWNGRPFQFGVAFNTMSYTNRSALYYAPKIDMAATVFGHGTAQLHPTIDFNLRLAVGVGHSRELGDSGTGATYNVQGGPSWHYDAWLLSLVGRYSQTIRRTPYTAQSVAISLGRGF